MKPETIAPAAPRVALAPSSCLPAGAHAVISRPARSAMTSGKRGTNEWTLRFEPRSAPYIEPLMGWTASDDTLQQVELSFPTAEAAIAYARRQGLSYTLQDWTQPAPKLSVVAASTAAERSEARARRQRLEWVERTVGADMLQARTRLDAPDTAAFDSPRDVLRAADLSPDQKRDALLRWAYESYVLERAHAPRERAEGARLGEIIDVLLDLEQSHAKAPLDRSFCHAHAA